MVWNDCFSLRWDSRCGVLFASPLTMRDLMAVKAGLGTLATFAAGGVVGNGAPNGHTPVCFGRDLQLGHARPGRDLSLISIRCCAIWVTAVHARF